MCQEKIQEKIQIGVGSGGRIDMAGLDPAWLQWLNMWFPDGMGEFAPRVYLSQ
jgi:hypothetical protein